MTFGSHENLGLGLKFVDRVLNSGDDGAGPRDTTRLRRHVLGDGWVGLIVAEEFIHGLQLELVTDEHIVKFALKSFLNVGARLNILKLGEQFEGTL